MDYNEFVDVILEILEDEVPEGICVKKSDVVKNNGLNRSGITFIEKGINASPTIYLEESYELFSRGKDVSELAEDILNCFFRNRLTKDVNLDFFLDYEKVKERLFCKLINKEMNINIMEQLPCEEFLDLLIVVYCRLDDFEYGEASIMIKREHLDKWGVSKEELLDVAKNNTRNKMKLYYTDIASLLREICGATSPCPIVDDKNVPLYVVTNKQRNLGAIFMIFEDIMNDFCDTMDGDYFVLPSSIHEFLIVSAKDEDDIEMYNHMVSEVNSETVGIEERLSDHAYLYRRIGGFSV